MNKIKEIIRAQKKIANARYYQVNSILGNTWAIFFVIIGARKTGKSYSITDFLLRQKAKKKDKVKNYWMRISETSTKAMLANKCKGLVDPDLVRKYDLDLYSKGAMYVYDKNHPENEELFTVIPLSQFGKMKGVGFYDKDFDGEYNIVLDEFQLEQNEKRTSFDILYNFIGMCENVARTTKSKIRVFLLGNTLQEASSILKAFNFIPEKFGRFYLKKKRCVIDNIEPTDEYLKDREGSIADILGGNDMSNYTNAITKDLSLLYKGRLIKPTFIIKFRKEKSSWYTVWDSFVIKRYNNEKLHQTTDFCMRPYVNSYYSAERKQAILDRYDMRAFQYKTLIDQAYFEADLQLLRKT